VQDDTTEPARSHERGSRGRRTPSVRTAGEDDIPRILDLYRSLVIVTTGAEAGRRLSPEDLNRVYAEISSMPGHELLVAESHGEVVGTMVLLVVPNLSHSALPWALVENLVVDPSHRRQGFGRLLLEHAVNRAKEAGCYKLTVSSDKRRREAHLFYGAMGFEPSAHGFRLYF